MSQVQNQATTPEQIRRAGENPYLDRVMRYIAIGVSAAVTFFAIAGIIGNISGTGNDLESQHNGGLVRIEAALDAKLNRYTTDLTSLGNDQNLNNHVSGTPNVLAASARASEIIQLHNDEYVGVEFIGIDSAGLPTLDFEIVNQNGSILPVETFDNLSYEPNETSLIAFTNIITGNLDQIQFSDFYIETNNAGLITDTSRVLMDGYIPIYANSATPVMVVKLVIDTAQLRDIINFAPNELVDGEGDASSRRVLLVVDGQNIIADSGALGSTYLQNLDASGGNINGNDYYQDLRNQAGIMNGTAFAVDDIRNGFIYSSRAFQSAEVDGLNWLIVITDDYFTYYAATIFSVIGVGLLAFLTPAVTIFFIKRALRPIMDSVYEADTLVQTTALESSVTVRSRGDQSELLTATRRVTTRINKLSEDLNTETRRRNRDLAMAGRISQQTATLQDLDTLANRSINVIANELGHYHAQIFLVDPGSNYADLRYSRGDAGRQLLEAGHRILIGTDSVVGSAAAQKRPIIVNDTQSASDNPHAPNQVLNQTRAEIGLPLLIDGEVIGVLDIQSRDANAFVRDDIPTYQLLADQLAVAIHNAQLREQSQQRIEQIAALNRQLTREAWNQLEERLDLSSEYGVQIEQPKLSADISIRGEVLGRLEADLPSGQTFSDGDQQILQSVAARISLAIENARLFQETQTSLSETSTLYQLSRQLNEANDLQDVLEAIIVSVAGNASGGQVWLFDDILPGESPDWARIDVDLPIMPRQQNVNLIGRRLQLSQYPFMQTLSPDEISTTNNIHEVDIIREDLLQLFKSINAISMVFIPLSMRGAWRGFMSISFDEPHRFLERELRVYNALISQAGVAIDNRLLYQQTEDALARQEKLYAASRIINTSQNLSDLVFAAVATSSNPALDFWLALLDGETDDDGWANEVHVVARSKDGDVSEADEWQQISIPEHSPMRRREPEILVDPGEDIEDVPQAVKWMRQLDYKFMAIFPLFSDNAPIALFYIVNKRSYDLSQDDYEVYRALTGQMSTQIQNKNLLRQTEKTLDEITRLYVATRAISGAQDTSAIYDAVAGHLAMPIIRQNARNNRELNLSMTVLLAHPEPNINSPQLRYDYFWRSDPTKANPISEGTIISQEDAPFGMLIENNDDGILIYKNFDDLPSDFPMIREILSANGATAAAAAPLWSRLRWFGVLIIRTDQPSIFDENYGRFMQSIADQVAIAVENQKLIVEAQFERQRLDEILQTLPVGVMVLDPETLEPMSSNDRVPELLGQAIKFNEPFSAEAYDLYRTGTNIVYSNNDLPMHIVQSGGQSAFPADDIVVYRESGYRIDISISAAPIFDTSGNIRAIVAAFNDISNLRSMENTMQENLRETVMLYEAQTSLTDAETLDDLLDALIQQLVMQQTLDAYIVLPDGDSIVLSRSLFQPLSDVVAIQPILQNVIVNVEDVQRYTGLDDDTRRVLAEVGARSVLVLPLSTRTRQRPLGWIILLDEEPEAFTSDQERTMTSITDMASQALDNIYLVESTQSALEETELLYNANNAISRASDLYELFDIIDSLLTALKPDMRAGYISIDDEFEEMFTSGFEDSIANGLNLSQLMQLSLPRAEGMYVADITRNTLSKFELEIAKAGDIVAFAAINLRAKDNATGRLLLGFKQARMFDASDERYLNTIADSASVVIDNQMLLSQVQSTLQETSVLYQASKALIDVNEPEEIVDVMVSYLIGTHITQVFIAQLNIPNWHEPIAAVNIDAAWAADGMAALEGITLSEEQFPAWRLLANDTVLTIDDVNDPDIDLSDDERLSIESLDIRSLVVMPLRVPGRVIGAIVMGSNETYSYTDRDVRIYQAFAEQTSLALEAKRLLEQTERRARQLQTSAKISQDVGQILDLDILLPQVVDLIQEQFGYDHVQIFLMDEENEWAILRASTGEAGEQLLSVSHRLMRGSQSVIGRVTELGEPTVALDTADAAVVHKPNPFLPFTRSEMALPMVVKGEIVGALDVQSNDANAFTDEDVQVLTTLSAQVAVAIDNARLYEDAESSAQDMSFLFQITSEAASAESIEEALDYVAGEIRANIRADLVAIYLPQTYEDYYGNRKDMIEIATISADEETEINNLVSVEVGDGESILGIVADHAQPQILQNIAHEKRYQPLTNTCQAALVLPIQSGTTVVGIIAVESQRINAFQQDTLQLLQTSAGSLGAVIQNTLLVNQLQESVEQLREVDRLKSQFLASMSHELRTPLNSIIGFSRVMLKGIDGPLSEMQEQDLTTIYNSGNHLLRLINDILDQAKIEANELNLKFTYFEMKPLVESVKSIAIGLLKEKPQLRFIVEVADGLPKVYGDEIRSRQILLNIVTNAIKFTEEGSVTVDVYAVEGEIGPMIRVDVIDTGMGIAEKDIGTVFEQFRQVDNSLTRTVGGTGLGLPISKSLAEMQGGQLTVVSELMVGSTFSVTIPTYEGADEDLERDREAKRSQQKVISPTMTSTTSSGLISRKDVEEARKRAQAEAANGGNGAVDPLKTDKTDTQEVKAAVSKEKSRIDTNVTQSIPIMTQKRDVILVEDDKKMVDQFRRILQREGFEVTTADFPAFAEAMIGQIRPRLVILDVNFAEGVGWELLKNLKERDDTFDIPVVVTTIDQDSERAYRLGAHTFIPRPFLPDDLLEAVLEAEKESQRERIVIIDDQPDAIRLLTQLLEEHSDFKIYSAQSGDEGISLVARRRPDLIILDLRMPGKDGFAVLHELRDNPETAKIPILVVTGEMDLSNSEQEQLVDIHVLRKTDISQEEYDLFIDNVRAYLESKNRRK